MKALGISIGLMGAVCGFGGLLMVYNFWLENPVGLPCHVVSRDGTLHIDDGLTGKKIFLINNRNSLLLAGQGGRSSYGPVPMTILDGLPPESSVHVEICGGQAVRLSSNGNEVYELTQERADADRVSGIEGMGRFAIVSFAAAMLGYLLARRASDS